MPRKKEAPALSQINEPCIKDNDGPTMLDGRLLELSLAGRLEPGTFESNVADSLPRDLISLINAYRLAAEVACAQVAKQLTGASGREAWSMLKKLLEQAEFFHEECERKRTNRGTPDSEFNPLDSVKIICLYMEILHYNRPVSHR